MGSSNIQRKLTAILCADVVGYSRLMGKNEAATLRALTEYQQVFADHIKKFRENEKFKLMDNAIFPFSKPLRSVPL